MITIKKTMWALIKANAKASRLLVDKKNKNLELIEKLQKENEELSNQITSMQSYVVDTTGHTTEDLVERVVTLTDKFDKDGKPLKKYDYVPKVGMVTYNEKTKMYEVAEPTDVTAEMPEVGSDYDADADKIKAASNEEPNAPTWN